MLRSTRKYLIENHSLAAGTVNAALNHVLAHCQANGITQLTLVVPSKASKGTVAYSDLTLRLGDKSVKALFKGESLSVDGVAIDMQSSATLSPHRSYGCVFGIHVAPDGLDRVHFANAAVWLPQSKAEGLRIAATWLPQTLGPKTWPTLTSTLPPVVETALEKLTEGVNLKMGLSHPSDKQAAGRTFAELGAQGIPLDHDAIHAWALRNGWERDHAAALKQVASKY